MCANYKTPWNTPSSSRETKRSPSRNCPRKCSCRPRFNKSSAPTTVAAQNLDDLERNAIIQALAQCHGNKKKAAQILGIQRPTLYNKMKRYAIEL